MPDCSQGLSLWLLDCTKLPAQTVGIGIGHCETPQCVGTKTCLKVLCRCCEVVVDEGKGRSLSHKNMFRWRRQVAPKTSPFSSSAKLANDPHLFVGDLCILLIIFVAGYCVRSTISPTSSIHLNYFTAPWTTLRCTNNWIGENLQSLDPCKHAFPRPSTLCWYASNSRFYRPSSQKERSIGHLHTQSVSSVPCIH